MKPLTARLCMFSISIAFFVTVAATTVAGQTAAARPDRGVVPNGSYSISDIEKINLQNGNLNLEIPLASLPPIAGDKLGWTLKAHYNSKLWNMNRVELIGERSDLSLVPYVVDTPELSDLGGWRISGQYEIEIRDARSEFDYQLPPVEDEPDYSLMNNYNWYKVVLRTPDGAEHELRPMDHSPFGGVRTFMYSYYSASPYTHGTMRYYSFDGSHIYATVTAQNNWTVILPDGTKVIQTTDGIQRLQDTNGNKIKIFTNGTGTHYQDEQTGREIRYLYDPAGNGGKGQGRVYYKTVTGVEKQITINFDVTTVTGQVYPVKDWIPGQFSASPCPRHSELNTDVPVISEIILPETETGIVRKFDFDYNSDSSESATNSHVRFSCNDPLASYTRDASKGWGSLSEMTTPSGAVIDYSYLLDSPSPFGHLPPFSDDIAGESIKTKTLSDSSTTLGAWTYNINSFNGVTTVTNPDGSTVTENQYLHSPAFGFTHGKAGLVYRSVAPFVRTDRHWVDMTFSGASTNSAGGPVSFNSVVDKEYTTLLDSAGNFLKMSAKAFQFDYNGNLIQTTEYDWFDPALVSRDAQGVPTGIPGSAPVLRVVNNSYYNPATTSTSGNVYAKRSISTGAPLILNALKETTAGSAITQLSYDGQAYGVAPTVGNLTSQKVWDDLDSKWITSSQAYGTYGNLISKTDPRGNVTQFYYDDATHALPTRVVVDPENGTGSQTTSTAYDYSTGLVTSQTDANGAITTIDYTNQVLGTVDPFGRPGIVYGPLVNANGVNQRQRTTTTYKDSLRQVIQASDLTTENDKLLKKRTTNDVLGRVILTEQTEDGINYTISSQQVYEQMGKISYSSNLARTASASSDGWTRTTKDTANRVIEVATFSGAAKPAATGYTNGTGKVTTAYDANFITVTDQAGKLRRSMVDALGRLVRLDEPDGSNSLGTTSAPVQPTSYGYSVLGNLTSVTQGVQTRTFTYDSLSRLRTAVNPESGTVTYQYDDNSNLTQRSDARSITTTFTYDALNRPTLKNYSDTTPDIAYFYDTQALPSGAPSFDRGNAKGRLVGVTYGGGNAGTYRGYDARGAVLRQYQRTDSVNYLTEATYHLSGALKTHVYPSVPGAADRRTVTYTNDSAGRLLSLSSTATSYAPAASVSGIAYSAPGGLSSETYGNNLIHAVAYNSRMQTNQIKLGTSGNPTSILSITYNYGTTTNNGNLLSTSYAGGGLSYTQTFGYDSLNRLTTSSEGSTWSQTNSYDRYGNRAVVGAALNFNASNNRITNAGYVYDAVGNLINDSSQAFTYDAENKITKVNNVSSYVYDGEGQRVKTLVEENLRFIYGLGGQLVAEFSGADGTLKKEYVYGANGLAATIEPTAVNSNGTRYITSDHLGSPRVVTNLAATVASRHDYKPFGDEIGPASVRGRPGWVTSASQMACARSSPNMNGITKPDSITPKLDIMRALLVGLLPLIRS